MRLFINPHSGTPVYRQLVDQLKRGVRGGILKPGEQLPTVRELALELTINPNTAARAYRELEAEGIITSIQGKGSFIAEEISFPQSEKETMLREMIRQLFREARQVSLSYQEIERVFLDVLKEEQRGVYDE